MKNVKHIFGPAKNPFPGQNIQQMSVLKNYVIVMLMGKLTKPG